MLILVDVNTRRKITGMNGLRSSIQRVDNLWAFIDGVIVVGSANNTM